MHALPLDPSQPLPLFKTDTPFSESSMPQEPKTGFFAGRYKVRIANGDSWPPKEVTHREKTLSHKSTLKSDSLPKLLADRAVKVFTSVPLAIIKFFYSIANQSKSEKETVNRLERNIQNAEMLKNELSNPDKKLPLKDVDCLIRSQNKTKQIKEGDLRSVVTGLSAIARHKEINKQFEQLKITGKNKPEVDSNKAHSEGEKELDLLMERASNCLNRKLTIDAFAELHGGATFNDCATSHMLSAFEKLKKANPNEVELGNADVSHFLIQQVREAKDIFNRYLSLIQSKEIQVYF